MNEKLKTILKNLPSQAGIYQFFNKEGEIIYIGKSVNLKSRVNSYFNGKNKLNFAKQKMITKITDIKYILVNNETESLILETNLIKKHLPKYNILMKDGKNYVYIKITDEEFPKIIKVRLKNKSGEYFGPYISSNDVDNILKIIKKVFGYGVAKHNFFKNKNNYNLDKYLFSSPLTPILRGKGEIKKIYFETLEKIKNFLKGNYKEVIENLEKQMMNFAKNLEFERAQKIKEQIESIKILKEKQIVREGIIGDFDIIYILEKFEKFFIGKLEIRDSKIIGFFPYEIENALKEDKKTIIKNFIKTNYINDILENKNLPIIITNEEVKLEEKIFKKLKIENPKKGDKLEILKMCYKNIYEFAYKKHMASLSTKRFTKQTMKNLLEILGFERINKDITFECNDISHFSGTHTVASRSVIVNGKLDKNKYRKFKIKTLKNLEINDFDSMREIAKRRVLELEKLGNYPDLIIIDGGKPQLSSVYEIFKKQKLKKNIQLVGIAKKEEILYKLESGNFQEFKLEKDSLELRLIQKLRDEAHRFAIGFNRDNRSKANKKNILESLPGIGPKTRKKILKEFGSIDNLAKQKKEDLEKILNKKVIEILENHGIIG